MSINHVVVSGNLGKDAELRQTSSGTSILSFSVAVNDRKQNKQTGEWENYPNWVNCTVFGKYAEAIASRATKGAHATVVGKLHYSSWDDKTTGNKRSSLDVWVETVEFSELAQKGNTAPVAAEPMSTTADAPSFYDEDIPF